MMQIYGINPIVEAMLYYAGKANNKCISKKLYEAIKQHPGEKDILIKAAQPAMALEKLLDSKLTVSKEIVDKYFKNLDNRYPDLPFGFCLAYIMVIAPLMTNTEYSAEEFARYLLGLTKAELIYSFRLAFQSKYETACHDQNIEKGFMKCIDDANLSPENKWKVLNVFFEFQKHIEELFSLIQPAAKLIKDSANDYCQDIDDFIKLYSGEKGKAILESYFELKTSHFRCIKLTPLLFGFNNTFVGFDMPDDLDSAECIESGNKSSNGGMFIMFIGIGRHILKCSEQNDIFTLSDKMQALSDSTRLEILFYLCSHREYGQELCTRFGLVRPALSYHIAKLQSAGFVTAEITGGKTYYEADKEGIRRMLDAFAEKIK